MTTPPELPLLDLDYLRRQTFGDTTLEGELLALFERQSARLAGVIADSQAHRERLDAAHTLKGSARAVGAWRLADEAERLEAALRDGGTASLSALLRSLAELAERTQAAAAERRAGASA
jgi:HPt (histidine-containing phosphotransfer) domain-containing protein